MNDLRYRLQGWDTKDLVNWLAHLREQRREYDEKGLRTLPQYKNLTERIKTASAELARRA